MCHVILQGASWVDSRNRTLFLGLPDSLHHQKPGLLVRMMQSQSPGTHQVIWHDRPKNSQRSGLLYIKQGIQHALPDVTSWTCTMEKPSTTTRMRVPGLSTRTLLICPMQSPTVRDVWTHIQTLQTICRQERGLRSAVKVAQSKSTGLKCTDSHGGDRHMVQSGHGVKRSLDC
jgi:hypothetical protein